MSRQFLTGMRAFYALLIGQFVSSMGSAITRFGLSVWVFSETNSTSAYTMLVFFSVFPVGVGALIAGPFVDRWNRRRVMAISDTIAGLSTLTIAGLFFLNSLPLWQLYMLLSISGVASAFSRPALDASIPLIVPQAQIGRAAGLSQLTGSLEMILSSTLAGLIIGLFGLGVVFLIDFVTFGFNIIVLLLTAIPQPLRDRAARATQSFWSDMVSGLRYIGERPGMVYLMGLFAITMFLLPGFAYSLLTPLVLTFASEQALGLILSSFGIGSLIGGTLLTCWGNSWRRMDGILASMMTAGLAALLISLRESALLIGIGSFITGTSFVFIAGLNRAIWQLKAAPEMLGRVFALQLALGVGAQSLGVLLSGSLADTVFEPLLSPSGALATSSVGALIGTGPGRGMALMFIVVGLLQMLIVLFSLLKPSMRLLEDKLPDSHPPASMLNAALVETPAR
ncbi:MAG TPA: MFS transporter [Roseiflexaceae bacterium]|nr:MFS transporter [Roseiflexaceae bacterium]